MRIFSLHYKTKFSFPSQLWRISDAEELIFITCKENIEPRGGYNWSWLSPERPKLLLGLEVERGPGVQELLWRERKVQGYWDAVTDFQEQLVILLFPPTSPDLVFAALEECEKKEHAIWAKGKVRKRKYSLLNIQGTSWGVFPADLLHWYYALWETVGTLGSASEKQGFPSKDKEQKGKCETGSRWPYWTSATCVQPAVSPLPVLPSAPAPRCVAPAMEQEGWNSGSL